MKIEEIFKEKKPWHIEWVSDVQEFLLSDEGRMDAWVAFRKEQVAKRERGIDTTKPEMTEIQPNVWVLKQ